MEKMGVGVNESADLQDLLGQFLGRVEYNLTTYNI